MWMNNGSLILSDAEKKEVYRCYLWKTIKCGECLRERRNIPNMDPKMGPDILVDNSVIDKIIKDMKVGKSLDLLRITTK